MRRVRLFLAGALLAAASGRARSTYEPNGGQLGRASRGDGGSPGV